MPAEVGARPKVDLPAKQACELQLEFGDPEHPGCVAGLELHEEVDVAVGSELAAQGGPEEAETADPVGAAEVGQRVSVDVNAGRELHGPSVALDMPAASPSGGVKPRHPLGFGVTPVGWRTGAVGQLSHD